MPHVLRHVRNLAAAALLSLGAAQAGDGPPLHAAAIGDGLELHYIEAGQGAPLVFVHGSLSDYTYWQGQFDAFAAHYHVIDYSRRYNWPNRNPARPGYSAAADADDLAALIGARHLGPIIVVGHSYGALTALFLAVRHPELVRALVLAEPPAVTLLRELPGADAAKGRAMSDDIAANMVAPMHAAFARGDREAGVAAFINYVFRDPNAWRKMPSDARAETLRNAHEWDVIMTTGTLFPELTSGIARGITAPTLLMSGAKSYPFLGPIDAELARVMPHATRVILPDVGHQMWLQQPERCRTAALAFLAALPATRVTLRRAR